MAVTAAPARGGRPPRAMDFVRLKLRLLRNGLRGQAWRIVAFVLGASWALLISGLAFIALGATGGARRDIGYAAAVLVGAAIVLGWTLVPLLFFGVDETLDPARFSLLPLRPGLLARGMLAAAFIGVPAFATAFVLSGLVVAAGIRFAGPGVLAGLLGAALGLVLGIVSSRAVTSAFAGMLRSRRVRDLAAVIIAILASSVWPAQWLLSSAVRHSGVGQAVRVADVVAWTPLGAPYALPYDVGEGRWLAAAARLAIALAAIGLLLWWWSHTIEPAMLDTTGGPSSVRAAPAGSGAVTALYPSAMRGMVPPTAFGAIVARESRYWWRDARRRASLISIVMVSAVLPLAFQFAGPAMRAGQPQSAIPLNAALSMAGTMGGMLLANQFAFDGNAYAAHLLTRVPGRTELRARALALVIVTVPVQAAVVVAVMLLARAPHLVPTALGMLATGFGAAIASASLLSVLAAYPLPDTSNPFAMNSGAGSAKGLLAMLAIFGTVIISTPVMVAGFYLTGAAGPWLVLVIGLAYGIGAAVIGTVIAGDVLDRRGPELLAAVTPRR